MVETKQTCKNKQLSQILTESPTCIQKKTKKKNKQLSQALTELPTVYKGIL